MPCSSSPGNSAIDILSHYLLLCYNHVLQDNPQQIFNISYDVLLQSKKKKTYPLRKTESLKDLNIFLKKDKIL